MRVPTRSSLTVLVTVLSSVVLAGCGQLAGDAGTGIPGFGNGDIAAEAEGVVVTVAELEAAVEDVMAGAPVAGLTEVEALTQRLEVQTQVLTAQLQVAIVEAAAEAELGVVISAADVDEAVAEFVELAGGQEAFDEALVAQGQTVGTIRQQERIRLLVEAIQSSLASDEPVTDADVEEALDARRSSLEQVSARHILVETEAQAQDVLARLAAGEEFAALAEELSQDPGSGANGGVLGLAPRGTFVPEFEAAIWDGPAEVGEVLGPVQTQFGFHVIVVDEFVVTPEDEAREQVRAELEQNRGGDLFGAWVSQTISDADPVVATRFGTWDRVQQVVVGPVTTEDPDA